MQNKFADLVCGIFFLYGDGQLWNPPELRNVTSNISVLAARFASQLQFHNIAEDFLASYTASKYFQTRPLVVMEMLASMVHVTMGDLESGVRHMQSSRRLSEATRRLACYRPDTQQFCDFLTNL